MEVRSDGWMDSGGVSKELTCIQSGMFIHGILNSFYSCLRNVLGDSTRKRRDKTELRRRNSLLQRYSVMRRKGVWRGGQGRASKGVCCQPEWCQIQVESGFSFRHAPLL